MIGDYKFVVAYQDIDNSLYGAAKIGTVSGTVVTFGSKKNFLSANRADWIAVAGLNEDKFVVAYEDNSDSLHGTAKIGTVSGTTITFGTEEEFLNPTDSTNWISLTALSTSGFVVAYRDGVDQPAGTHSYAQIGTVSGSGITFGVGERFYTNSNVANISLATLDESKFVVVYRDKPDSFHGTAKIGTISGTTVTFGPESEFYSTGRALYTHVSTFDANRIIVGYSDQDSGHGGVNVGTIDDTTIVFGDQFKYLAESGAYTRTDREHHIVTLGDAGRFVVTYRDASDSGHGTARIGALGVDAFGDLFIEGSNDVSSSGLPLRIVHHLVRTGDYDPQLIGSFDNGGSSVNIRVWNIVDGVNAQVDIANSGCYSIGDTGKWGWSTRYIPFASGRDDYHYYFEMIADNDEVEYGEFFLTVPERGRWVHP
jgi:hypothetical protein